MSNHAAAHRPSRDGLAVSFVRSWTRLYTARMSIAPRERRRSQIESDTWEHTEDQLAEGKAPGSLGLEMFGRCLRGMPADLLWRFHVEGPSMNIHISVDRVAGILLLGMVVFLIAGTSINGYDTSAAMDGELKRLASVSSGANTVLFTLSGIGLLVAAAGLMYAFRERAPGLAYLIGAGLIASGTLVLVSTALYSAAAEFADEYVAGNGAAAEQASASARMLLIVSGGTTVAAALLGFASVTVLAFLTTRLGMVARWTLVLPAISIGGMTVGFFGDAMFDSDKWGWIGYGTGIMGAVLWLLIAGGWLAFGGSGPKPTKSANSPVTT